MHAALHWFMYHHHHHREMNLGRINHTEKMHEINVEFRKAKRLFSQKKIFFRRENMRREYRVINLTRWWKRNIIKGENKKIATLEELLLLLRLMEHFFHSLFKSAIYFWLLSTATTSECKSTHKKNYLSSIFVDNFVLYTLSFVYLHE